MSTPAVRCAQIPDIAKGVANGPYRGCKRGFSFGPGTEGMSLDAQGRQSTVEFDPKQYLSRFLRQLSRRDDLRFSGTRTLPLALARLIPATECAKGGGSSSILAVDLKRGILFQ